MILCECWRKNADDTVKKKTLYRNLIAFWLLGLCFNYAYYIMISAAHDILDQTTEEFVISDQNSTEGNATCNETEEEENERDCNKISTGIILMASVIPALLIKVVAPFVTSFISLQMVVVILMNTGSFLLVSFSEKPWMTYTGIVLASISGGLGEVTLLKLQVLYDKNSLSAFSSGCGFSGFVGSFSYAGITASGLTPRTTLLVMITIPFVLALTYFLVLTKPSNGEPTSGSDPPNERNVEIPIPAKKNDDEQQQNASKFSPRFKLILVLMPKYILPLMSVYFCQYFSNQGLFELMYFRSIWLTHEEQYRWYQVVYQIGVFISKSSMNVVIFKRLWILSALQVANTVLFVVEAYLLFLPTIWIVFVVILWEGLVGGCTYVSTYFRISHEVEEGDKQFAIAVTSFWETLGVVVASFLALPMHQLFCQIPIGTSSSASAV